MGNLETFDFTPVATMNDFCSFDAQLAKHRLALYWLEFAGTNGYFYNVKGSNRRLVCKGHGKRSPIFGLTPSQLHK